jgi:hypothetical protein
VTRLGLEIPSDQQEKIDAFMKTGDGLDDIQLYTQIDCSEYQDLFQVLRKTGGPIWAGSGKPRVVTPRPKQHCARRCWPMKRRARAQG